LGARGETFAVDALTRAPKLRPKESFVPVVEIYTKTFCNYCWRAKMLLESKGVAYREISVDFGGPDKETMVQRAGGRTTVPQIFIGEAHVGGCDELLALEGQGKLDPMIAI
jgi:glutaredoxin 3